MDIVEHNIDINKYNRVCIQIDSLNRLSNYQMLDGSMLLVLDEIESIWNQINSFSNSIHM